MVECVVKFLVERVSNFIIQEASLVGSVGYELNEIKMELQSIHSFLREADRRKDSNELVRAWINQVRDVAFDMEDIIDEFMICMGRGQRGSRLKALLHDIGGLPAKIMKRHQLAAQIQQIKHRVQAISERRNRYGLVQIEEERRPKEAVGEWLHIGETAILIEDNDMVGITEKLELLVGWMTEEEQRRLVISVVGMGGVGKSTLVAKALKTQIVKKHFDCHSWITVSQSYKTDELLRSMIKELFEAMKEEIPSDLFTMNTRQLIQILNGHLHSKRYVIVLDDVWSIDAWKFLSIAFPNNRNGSRIILTTRNEDVTHSIEGSRTYLLQPLHEEEAWDLFCKKAFWKEQGKLCPSNLLPFAQVIVEKCEGLPLAIVSMGCLLSLKEKNVLEWESGYNSLRWDLCNNPMLKQMKAILMLSFNDLPYYLKRCFLYCSIFPEDYLIKRKRLIRLWIAEGFVEERSRLTMEEVAEIYLKELVHRNMLQVAKINHFGRMKAFRMHDLLRETALSISQEEKFFMDFSGDEAGADVQFRRLAVYKSNENFQLCTSVPRVHSLFVFVEDMSSSIAFKSMKSCFRLLTVLDLEGAPIRSVPDELVKLFNLRYLNLKGTKVKKLPKSIGRLRNLQTLNVSDTNMEKLPDGVVQLQKLRHLLTYNVNLQITRGYKSYNLSNSVKVPRGICHLKSLQSLCCIQGERDAARQLRNLTQLTMFAIIRVRAVDGPDLCISIGNMKRLCTLGVAAENEDEPLQLGTLSSPPPLLQKLLLYGLLEKVPHWFSSLTNLSYLYLYKSRLREDALLSLRALPSLVLLQLVNAYVGQELCFHAGWFPALKKLRLCDMRQLNSLVIEDGTLQCIQQLSLFQCMELKSVPVGIEFLRGMQELYLEEKGLAISPSLSIVTEVEKNGLLKDYLNHFLYFHIDSSLLYKYMLEIVRLSLRLFRLGSSFCFQLWNG